MCSGSNKSEGGGQGPGDVYERAYKADLAGLAFSGGGIRSATFNLGVIQALSRYGLLSRFDYLSTVSGGGYIGSWLSALLHRETARRKGQEMKLLLTTDRLPKTGTQEANFEAVLSDELTRIAALRAPEPPQNGDNETKKIDDPSYVTVGEHDVRKLEPVLKTHPSKGGYDDDGKNAGFEPVEHVAVRYLRRYSNFLTPRLGLSGDVLALLSMALRNITVIQLALISLVASFLLGAHVLVVASTPIVGTRGWSAWLPSLVALGLAVVVTGWLISRGAVRARPSNGGAADRSSRTLAAQQQFRANIAANVIAALLIIAAWRFAVVATAGDLHGTASSDLVKPLLQWVQWVTPIYAFAWMLGFGIRWGTGGIDPRIERGNKGWFLIAQVSSSIFAGSLLSVLLFLLVYTVELDLWHTVAFGPPALLLVISFVVTLHIGAVRRAFSHHDREFLARLGGIILLYAALWAVAFVFVLYATPFVHWLAAGGAAALAAWIGGSAIGTWFARGDQTGADSAKKSRSKEIVTRITPWFFIAGLTIIVAWATQTLLYKAPDNWDFAWPTSSTWSTHVYTNLTQLQNLDPRETTAAFVGLLLLFFVVTWRLDINLFSLHTIYWNRLTRAYLGASCAPNRSPNPFTGFDTDDDLKFHELAWQRPLHIVNTAINMTGGDDLAWQTRRAASFSFTPLWAGYEARSSQGENLGKFRPTSDYAGGRRLGTWVAVSGAAASPNMGYHTSAAVAGLLTAFNLRLGRWCGNPEKEKVWRETSPMFAALPIISELTGSANAQSRWINLTDGGHFENLAVYELIRRRCKLVVVVDAGCDPRHQFDDLANMIRKCWVDFGANIRIDNLKPLYKDEKTRRTKAHFVFGRIQYRKKPDSKKDNAYDEGALVYIKPSLTGSEWPDIKQYADENTDFPHETTADQFFNENQFEAYRHLGYKSIAFLDRRLEKLLGDDYAAKSIEEIASGIV